MEVRRQRPPLPSIPTLGRSASVQTRVIEPLALTRSASTQQRVATHNRLISSTTYQSGVSSVNPSSPVSPVRVPLRSTASAGFGQGVYPTSSSPTSSRYPVLASPSEQPEGNEMNAASYDGEGGQKQDQYASYPHNNGDGIGALESDNNGGMASFRGKKAIPGSHFTNGTEESHRPSVGPTDTSSNGRDSDVVRRIQSPTDDLRRQASRDGQSSQASYNSLNADLATYSSIHSRSETGHDGFYHPATTSTSTFNHPPPPSPTVSTHDSQIQLSRSLSHRRPSGLSHVEITRSLPNIASTAPGTEPRSPISSTPRPTNTTQTSKIPSATPAVPSSSAVANSSSNPTYSSRRQDPVMPHAAVSNAPSTGMYWSRTPASGRIPRGMRAHSATVVDGDVWCFGGCDNRGTCSRDIWKFDCDTFIWTKPKVTGEAPPVTRAHTTIAYDKRLYVIGGGDGPTYYNETYIFDTLSLTWSKPLVQGKLPSSRRAHTSVLYDYKIVVFGGGNGATALNDVHTLDVADLRNLKWRKLATSGKAPIARGYHSMNLVGSKCVVFGGSDGTECFADVHILDLETLRWTEVKTDPDTIYTFPRLSHTSTCIGSYLFIVGGHDGVNFSSEIVLFNLVTLQWEPKKAYGIPPSARGYHMTVLHDSRLFVIGGFNGQSVFDEVFTLDLGGNAFLPQITNFVIDEIGVEEGR